MDILEDLIAITDEALITGELDESARKRAEKFRDRCDQAWLRLDRGNSLAHERVPHCPGRFVCDR